MQQKKRQKGGKDERKGRRKEKSPELPHPQGLPSPRRGHPLQSGASHTEKVPLLVKSLFRMLLKNADKRSSTPTYTKFVPAASGHS